MKEVKHKGTIVCIHGNCSSSKVFNHLKNSKAIPYQIIANDLPGNGENSKASLSKENLFKYYKGLLIEQINNINDDVLLVGNSLGGHLAIEIASSVTRLKGLVIMGTPPVRSPINFEEAFLPVEALSTFLTENPEAKAIEEAAKVAVYDTSFAKYVISDFKAANPKIRTMIASDLLGGKLEDEYNDFINLCMPKFIIRGLQDPSVNPDYLNALQNDCADNCEIIEIDNCGHYPSLEQPELFNRAILKICKTVFNFEK